MDVKLINAYTKGVIPCFQILLMAVADSFWPKGTVIDWPPLNMPLVQTWLPLPNTYVSCVRP